MFSNTNKCMAKSTGKLFFQVVEDKRWKKPLTSHKIEDSNKRYVQVFGGTYMCYLNIKCQENIWLIFFFKFKIFFFLKIILKQFNYSYSKITYLVVAVHCVELNLHQQTQLRFHEWQKHSSFNCTLIVLNFWIFEFWIFL